jgi:hypothetical protein
LNKRGRDALFFIPYGHIKIKSGLKVDEIERRLKEQFESHSIISGMFRGNHKYFQGSFENEHFKMNRIIHYRNSFRPVIIGNLQPEINHTAIELTVRIDYFVLVPFIVFLLLFGFPVVFYFLQSLISAEKVEFLRYLSENYWLKFALSSTGTCLFFYFPVMIAFNVEASKAIKYLNVVFESHVVSQQNSKNFFN